MLRVDEMLRVEYVLGRPGHYYTPGGCRAAMIVSEPSSSHSLWASETARVMVIIPEEYENTSEDYNPWIDLKYAALWNPDVPNGIGLTVFGNFHLVGDCE